MRIIPDPSVSVVLQHTLSGVGNFTGVEIGRASRTIGSSGARVTLKAKSFGVDDHVYRVQFVDPGGVVPVTQAVWATARQLKVYLRRNAGGLLATAQEVADVVNAGGLLFADAGGTDVVAAAADAALAGGLDPNSFSGHYRFTPASGVHGGLFFFDDLDALDVLQVSGKFVVGGDTALKVEIVSLGPGLAPTEAEAVTTFSTTITTAAPTFITSGTYVLAPRQAVRVTCAAPGMVQVIVRRTERPYLSA